MWSGALAARSESTRLIDRCFTCRTRHGQYLFRSQVPALHSRIVQHAPLGTQVNVIHLERHVAPFATSESNPFAKTAKDGRLLSCHEQHFTSVILSEAPRSFSSNDADGRAVRRTPRMLTA